MKKLNEFILVSTLGLLSVVSAHAYENADDAEENVERQIGAYDAQGLHLGSFTLYPTMALGNEYDSNIYRRQQGAVGSYVAHFKPGFVLQSDWSRHELKVLFDTDLTVFSAQTDENNYHDIFLMLGGRFDVLRDSFFEANFNYNNVHEDRGSPDQQFAITPTFYDNKSLDMAYTHKFNRVSVKPGFKFSRLDYLNPTTGAGQKLLMDTRNHWEFIPELRVGYAIQPEYEAFVKFTWKQMDYDNLVLIAGVPGSVAQNRNSHGYNILAGMAFELTELLTGDISIGYLQRDYDAADIPSISGVNGFINLKWQPTTLTSVLFNFSRDINETTQRGTSGVVATSPSISIEHELLRNVVLSTGGSYSYNEYRGTTRTDDLFGAQVGAKYLLSQYLSLGLNYNYMSRDANNVVNSDYAVHEVMFNINGQM